jgi:hypothetical protein
MRMRVRDDSLSHIRDRGFGDEVFTVGHWHIKTSGWFRPVVDRFEIEKYELICQKKYYIVSTLLRILCHGMQSLQ